MSVMKCTAAGDAMIFRQLPGHYEGFEALRDFIAQGELRFLNLETTIHNFETYGAALSGGSWFCAEPHVLDGVKDVPVNFSVSNVTGNGGVKEFGFNMLTTANNHAMDYSHAGLLKTLEYLQAAGLPTCGTGRSLAEAAAPIYLDAPGGRYAVIGACSTFYPDAMAGEQTRTMPGRPGLNGLRFDTRYELPEAQLAQLREIAAALDLNADRELERSQGYLPELPDGAAEFGAMRIARADKPGIRTRVNETDMARTATILNTALQICANLAIAFEPFLPFTAEKLSRMLGLTGLKWADLGRAGLIAAGSTIGQPELLFEKIEDDTIQAQLDRLARIKEENKLNSWKPAPQLPDVAFDDFLKTDIRVGTVKECKRVPKADKLLQFLIDDGMGDRTIVSGIAKYYKPEDLVGKQVCFVANFAPRKLKGVESQGMILSAENPDGSLTVIGPTGAVQPGAQVK